MKQIKYRQRTKTGCGSFSIANIFDDHRMVEDIPKIYESIPYLNRKIAKFHRGYYLDPQFITCAYFRNGYKLQSLQAAEFFARQAADVTDANRATKGIAIPYLITISRRNGSAHMVPIIHDLDSNIYYAADSCTDYVQRLTLHDLLDRYNITSISVIHKWHRSQVPHIVFANKKEFAHIY